MVVSVTWKYNEPKVGNVTRGRSPSVTFQLRVVIFPCPSNHCVSYVLSYDQLQESWIISCLQWRNSPNYCSWLAVRVNYSANFYCKIVLINRFKPYLIKTDSKTPKKNKKTITKSKQKQRRIYLMFAFSESHVTSPRGDIIMSPGVTL